MMAGIVKRSVRVAGHRTSVSLEAEFWDEIQRLSALKGVPLSRLVAEIDAGRETNLSSALRLYVLRELKSVPGRAE